MTEKIKSLMSMPPLASEHGAQVDSLILYIHYLMAALFVVWIIYFAYVLVRFRARAGAKADHTGYQGHASTWLEIGVAVVEGIILIGLAIPLWADAADGFPATKDASGQPIRDAQGKLAVTEVRVIAQQFAWNSRYPGNDGNFGKQDLQFVTGDNKFGVDPNDAGAKDDVTPPLNDIVIPVNKPAIFHITSMDVIHNFAVHPLRVMQDAIPGVMISTHVKPTLVGKYQITCAQLCGNSHYFMKGFLEVKSQEDYDKWVAEKSKGAATVLE